MLKILFLILVSSFSYAQDTATSTHFVPTPISLDLSDRISGGIGLEVSPSVELEIAYLYKVWDGLDIGVGLHGGVTGEGNTGGILGADVVLRFVRQIGGSFFMGFQTQIGCVYTGLGDVSKAINAGGAFPVTLGLVLGGVLHESTQLYFFPALQFGQTMNDGDPLWKSGVGLQFSLGTAIEIVDSVRWVIEVTPEITNLTGHNSAWKSFNIAALMGLVFDF